MGKPVKKKGPKSYKDFKNSLPFHKELIALWKAECRVLERERDAVDWGIRQLRQIGVLDMRQMVLVLRMWSGVIDNNRKRLSIRKLKSLVNK
jgi:hypothetical protein